MVKIRLRRVGAKKRPSYRVVVADSRASRDGKFIEIVGTYNPLTDPATIVMDKEKISMWMGRGAQPTERVSKLLSSMEPVDEYPKINDNPETKDSADNSPILETQTQMNAEEKE